jgi:coenzyme F420-reducing hydrogenase beta subunit
MGFSVERGEAVLSMRYDHNVTAIAKTLQAKGYLAVYEISITETVSRHLQDKNKKHVRSREAGEIVDGLNITLRVRNKIKYYLRLACTENMNYRSNREN